MSSYLKPEEMIRHPVPNEHLIQIGDITVSFALLELKIKLLTWSLISRNQKIGQIITAEMSFKNVRALLISIYIENYGQGEKLEELKRLLNLASNIENKRNQITHSVWGAGKDINHITRIKTTAKGSKGLQHKFEEVSISDLKEFSTEIKQVAESIQNFNA